MDSVQKRSNLGGVVFCIMEHIFYTINFRYINCLFSVINGNMKAYGNISIQAIILGFITKTYDILLRRNIQMNINCDNYNKLELQNRLLCSSLERLFKYEYL